LYFLPSPSEDWILVNWGSHLWINICNVFSLPPFPDPSKSELPDPPDKAVCVTGVGCLPPSSSSSSLSSGGHFTPLLSSLASASSCAFSPGGPVPPSDFGLGPILYISK